MKLRLTLLSLTLTLFSLCAYSQNFDFDRSEQLRKEFETRQPTKVEYDYMIEECEKFVDRFISVTRDIKKLPTLDERKEAATNYNKRTGNDYNIYMFYLRRLQEGLGNDTLTSTQAIEVDKLLSDNKYINRMFTKYRSRYEL
ncbi:MAG: hypothetical protein NC338_06940 [Firmicutes bacterium]|nr:hypothetical protein [Bacillota bacterium]MCM1400911.1 hypothetical protein [Bacteroides sp.]MCM1476564.1 hypothetical protein [Bacteroides sp.]